MNEDITRSDPGAASVVDRTARVVSVKRRQPFDSHLLLPALASGLIIGVSIVLWSFTLASLVFSGELAPFMQQGAGFLLTGSAVLVLVMALTSSYRGTVGMSDEAAGVILSLVASNVAITLGANFDPHVAFATVMAAVVLSTLLCGLTFIGLGYFKLGNLVRFIPHPVVGGVVVTMAWLLVIGALSVMTDIEPGSVGVEIIRSPQLVVRWLPGVVFALTLLIAMRRWDHFLTLPLMFLGAIGLFYTVVSLLDIPLDSLHANGFLMGPFPDQDMIAFGDMELVRQVEWSALVNAIPDLMSLILLCVLGLLLTATALEAAVNSDMDLNRELKSAGVANLLTGLFGGITGCHSLEDSLVAREIGAPTRLVGVVACLVCLAVLGYGAEALSYLPKSLLGGFILYFGLILLQKWVVEAWFRVPKADYFIVITCLLVSVSAGYIEGITVGIVAGIAIFVINYSRIDVIKHALSGAEFRSHVERDASSKAYLHAHGEAIHILKLQGFIFFGTAHRIYQQIVSRVNDASLMPIRFVVLDFRSVSDMDMSAIASFEKIRQLVEHHSTNLVVVDVNETVTAKFERSSLIGLNDKSVVQFSDVDLGLEWCENQLLEDMQGKPDTDDRPLAKRMLDSFPEPALVPELMARLERITVEAGRLLIRQGSPSSDLYFIETGRIAIMLEITGRKPVRLRSMGPGTVVGEVALYLQLPRSASVIAECDSVIYRLTRESLDHMKQQHPSLSASFNEFIARLLAARLSDTNIMLSALLE
ncbi:MAG: sulfate permease [marine bacterium B5-7]|nr:MAG: sulfate permease [marine bacterium B5-7]